MEMGLEIGVKAGDAGDSMKSFAAAFVSSGNIRKYRFPIEYQ